MVKGTLPLILAATVALATPVRSDRQAQEEARQEEARRALTRLEKDYVLLNKGKFELEYTFSFTYYSANQIYLESFAILDPVFLTLGKFGVESAKRHIFVNTIALRYGILDNLQIDLNVPFVYRYDRVIRQGTGGQEQTMDRAGIGDVSLNLSFQPIRETKSRPAIILNFGYKSKTGKSPYEIDPKNDVPTGTGYQSLRFSLSWVKSIDPVVVYGSMGYMYNMPESVDQTVEGRTLEKVYPGDTISLALGFAYALAYNFSMNVQYINNYILPTYVKTAGGSKSKVAGSTFNSAMLKLGTGWAISPKLPLSFSLYIGLTNDSPDYTVEVRVPFKF